MNHDILIALLTIVSIINYGYIRLIIKMVYFIPYELQYLYYYRKILLDLFQLNHVIPQGFVLGPSLFSIKIRPMADIIKNFTNIHYHIFTVDIQLFILFPLHSHNTITSELIECANCIRAHLQQTSKYSSKTTVYCT